MAGLKSFLFGAAPILGVTAAALYERQRALVGSGVLKPAPGRGPGSGVPLTAESIAAVLISVLAVDGTGESDSRVRAILDAYPEDVRTPSPLFRERFVRHRKAGRPTFQTEVARVLSGKDTVWYDVEQPRHYRAIRVSRCWRGEIVGEPRGKLPLTYLSDTKTYPQSAPGPIGMTAAIEGKTLEGLIAFTKGALSQLGEGDD